MSATLLNCFGEKEINPNCKSFMDCILYHAILNYVNLINISLQLTFFLQILHTKNMLLLHEFQGVPNS